MRDAKICRAADVGRISHGDLFVAVPFRIISRVIRRWLRPFPVKKYLSGKLECLGGISHGERDARVAASLPLVNTAITAPSRAGRFRVPAQMVAFSSYHAWPAMCLIRVNADGRFSATLRRPICKRNGTSKGETYAGRVKNVPTSFLHARNRIARETLRGVEESPGTTLLDYICREIHRPSGLSKGKRSVPQYVFLT